MSNRPTLTHAERIAIIESGRGQPLILDAETAKQLARGHLEQVCPDCGRREAAHPYCSGCLLSLTPADWQPTARTEAQRAAARRVCRERAERRSVTAKSAPAGPRDVA